MTRAEAASVLAKITEPISEEVPFENPYKDVAEEEWYYKPLVQLTQANIICGYEDKTFRPNEKIKRSEFATIISRMKKSRFKPG